MKVVKVFVASFFVASCAHTLTQAAGRLVESDGRSVQSCVFLKTVHASNFSGLLFIEQGLSAARTDAMNEMADLGATHFVWGPSTTGTTQTVSAQAYRCPK